MACSLHIKIFQLDANKMVFKCYGSTQLLALLQNAVFHLESLLDSRSVTEFNAWCFCSCSC